MKMGQLELELFVLRGEWEFKLVLMDQVSSTRCMAKLFLAFVNLLRFLLKQFPIKVFTISGVFHLRTLLTTSLKLKPFTSKMLHPARNGILGLTAVPSSAKLLPAVASRPVITAVSLTSAPTKSASCPGYLVVVTGFSLMCDVSMMNDNCKK